MTIIAITRVMTMDKHLKVTLGCFIAAAILALPLAFSADDHPGHSEDDHDDHSDHEEGIVIAEDIQELINLELAEIGPQQFPAIVRLNGRIHPNAERLAAVRSRFPGVVLETKSELGDQVKSGQTLAFIEANGSLSRFPLQAGISGTVVEKKVVPGQFVDEHSDLYKVIDLTDVWVDLLIPDTFADSVKKGQTVWLTIDQNPERAEGSITYVSPMVHADSQTRFARVVMPNADGRLLPGDFVIAEVKVADVDAKMAVESAAVQTINDRAVIFVRTAPAKFMPRQVTLGKKGLTLVEVLDGLSPGEKYVTKNSYTLKAEMMKAAAGHDHSH